MAFYETMVTKEVDRLHNVAFQSTMLPWGKYTNSTSADDSNSLDSPMSHRCRVIDTASIPSLVFSSTGHVARGTPVGAPNPDRNSMSRVLYGRAAGAARTCICLSFSASNKIKTDQWRGDPTFSAHFILNPVGQVH